MMKTFFASESDIHFYAEGSGSLAQLRMPTSWQVEFLLAKGRD